MLTARQIANVARFRQAVVATLEEHSGQAMSLDEIQEATRAKVKFPPHRGMVILRQMAQNGLVAKAGQGKYTALNGVAITKQKPLGFMTRLERIESKLDAMLAAWGIKG